MTQVFEKIGFNQRKHLDSVKFETHKTTKMKGLLKVLSFLPEIRSMTHRGQPVFKMLY